MKHTAAVTVRYRTQGLARVRSLVLAAAVPLVVAACGDEGGEPLTGATIEIVYKAPTALDPAVAQEYPGCVEGAQPTHVHPQWLAYKRRTMEAMGDSEWRVTLTGVPTDREQWFRINDPNECVYDVNGAVTSNIYMNGVLLTRVVQTPGNGPEPGLAFRVHDDGTVDP